MKASNPLQRIVILGGRGMLGTDLAEACGYQGIETLRWDVGEIDICDEQALRDKLPGDVDWVVNCAAYTRVDDAEKERELAMRINGHGAGSAARACAARGLRLLHVSTDYVFNGAKGTPWIESDPVAPLNFYGETKLEGERQVTAAGGASLIMRTESLYGLGGRNFIKAILNQILQGKTTLRVVSDQVSSPTFTPHLATAMIRLMRTARTGIVHTASSGSCSWFDFAKTFVDALRPGIEIVPLRSSELNFPAQRPPYSVLDTSRYTEWTGQPMPAWQEGLAAYLALEPLAAQVRAMS